MLSQIEKTRTGRRGDNRKNCGNAGAAAENDRNFDGCSGSHDAAGSHGLGFDSHCYHTSDDLCDDDGHDDRGCDACDGNENKAGNDARIGE